MWACHRRGRPGGLGGGDRGPRYGSSVDDQLGKCAHLKPRDVGRCGEGLGPGVGMECRLSNAPASGAPFVELDATRR